MKNSSCRLLFLIINAYFLVFLIHPNLKASEEDKYKLVIAAIFQNEAPYLKEWIEYHHLLGVEHFWLYDDMSTDHWREVLKPYISKGIVEVFDWSKDRRAGRSWPAPQINAYKDALTKGVGVTEWLALIDIDEFILPMQTEDKTITECLAKHFAHASAIYVNWRHFGTSNLFLSKGEMLLPRLTACSERNHSSNSIGKSIFRPKDTLINKLWYPHHCGLQPGCIYVNGNAELLPLKCIVNKKGQTSYDLHNNVHYDKYLRINHYFFRDESYFWEFKYERKRKRGIPDALIMEHVESFNKQRDYTLINFLKKNYPTQARKIWGL